MQIDSAPRKSPSRPRAPYSRPSIRHQQPSPTPQQQQQQQQHQEQQEERQEERQEEESEAPNSNCCYITCMIISIGAFGFLYCLIVRSSSLLFNSFISLSIAPCNNQFIHLNIFNYCFRSTFLGRKNHHH
jgi:hypothetical protein